MQRRPKSRLASKSINLTKVIFFYSGEDIIKQTDKYTYVGGANLTITSNREISLFLRNKIGRFLRELFKVLPKTIGLRRVVLRRCLFFMLLYISQSYVVKPAMTMICHFYASQCPLVLNRGVGADSVVSFKSPSFFCNIIGHINIVRKTR